MSKNELITIIVNSPSINATLNTVQPYELQDDFRSHFYLQLCEKSLEKLLAEFNKCPDCLERYAGAIIKLQLKSNNSSFHRQYRKNTTLSIDERDSEGRDKEDIGDDNKMAFESYEYIVGFLQSPDNITEEQAFLIEEKNYQKILLFLNHIHPKKAKLFIEHYVNNKSIKEISKQYKIKYSTVVYNIRQTEKLIRDQVKFESD